MSDIIKLLPDSVANQIAAGEVIQRPASVVKELVENAVDAGAKHIHVIIRDAGRTLIQVVDDGKGMSSMDARMAFERHATSKITQADDLFSLHTMGFRGEALASIAAVAQVEMLTMRQGDEVGTKLLISGSLVESQEPAATVPGTNMMVKNLFFNVPARRKFLKKDAVELSNILHEFERLALVNPGVEMKLTHNDAIVHQLMPGGLKQRIGGLFGKGMERQMVPVTTTTSIVTVNGFVGLPENARKRGALQYLFVNGRNMRHPYFHKAVMHCYEQLIPQDEQPNYFLDFQVDPSTIDVNIHPTKNEIKFENEQPIWQILVAAIKESLGKYNIAPSIDFDAEDVPDIPAFNPNTGVTNDFGLTGDYNPFAAENSPSRSGSSAAWQRDSRSAVSNWESLYESFTRPASTDMSPDVPDTVASRLNEMPASHLDMDVAPQVAPMFQVCGKYIVSSTIGGLLIVDQHRAHVRVLYDELSLAPRDENMPSQAVIFPDTVTLSKAENAIVETNLSLIESIGFALSYLGDETWIVNGLPAAVSPENSIALLRAIVADLTDETPTAIADLRDRMLLNVARASAMVAGRVLSQDEMQHLMSRLLSSPSPSLTPDGNRIIVELNSDSLSRLF